MEATTRSLVMEKQLEEIKSRESHLKSTVKVCYRNCIRRTGTNSASLSQTLREELRKVQSSAALLERQRNPGVGYWAANGSVPPSSSRLVGTPSSERGPILNGSAPPSPAPPAEVAPPGGRGSTSSDPSGVEEAVNLEYLRNVILQFLENEKMRVCPLSLRLTPMLLANLPLHGYYSRTSFVYCLSFSDSHRRKLGAF